MKEGYTVSDEDLLEREGMMSHPLVAALREAGHEVRPGHNGYNEDSFTGLVFRHGVMQFTVAITRDGNLLLKLLERVGGPHGLRPTWRDLEWFADFCKARPELGIRWMLGKIKAFDSGPYYSSQQSLKKVYCELSNCVRIGHDGRLEWVGVDLRDHESLEVLRKKRLEGRPVNRYFHP